MLYVLYVYRKLQKSSKFSSKQKCSALHHVLIVLFYFCSTTALSYGSVYSLANLIHVFNAFPVDEWIQSQMFVCGVHLEACASVVMLLNSLNKCTVWFRRWKKHMWNETQQTPPLLMVWCCSRNDYVAQPESFTHEGGGNSCWNLHTHTSRTNQRANCV